MTLEILPDADFLRVTCSGEFSLDEARRAFREIVDAALEHLSKRIILDGRGLRGEPEIIERFCYAEFAAEMCKKMLYDRGIVPVFAYVLHEPVLDRQRFGETVARNRGMFVKAFDDMNEAHQWLQLQASNREP